MLLFYIKNMKNQDKNIFRMDFYKNFLLHSKNYEGTPEIAPTRPAPVPGSAADPGNRAPITQKR